MKTLALLGALSALALTSPVLAKSHNEGAGKGKGQSVAAKNTVNKQDRRFDVRRAAYSGDGRGYWDNDTYWRDGRSFGSNCPPGLAKKNNGCLPPGQAKSQWNVGQRLPVPYRDDYIPSAYRDRYNDGTYRYYNGYVYQVDPQTYVIQRVISALLR
jgi:Ni/Co efflux regulator RcnB